MSVMADWVGASEERAIQLAQIAAVGSERPSDIAVWLLEHYGQVRQIRSGLAAEFRAGSWIGEVSGFTRRQIEHMRMWATSSSQAVRDFAHDMLESLERALEQDVQDEEEGRW